MANHDLQAQLEALRKELSELAARQQEDRSARLAATEAADGAAPSGVTGASSHLDWLRGMQQQFEELLHQMKIELNETPAATALTIFALGVVVGRLMSK